MGPRDKSHFPVEKHANHSQTCHTTASGFCALPEEIYLEIISQKPATPLQGPGGTPSKSDVVAANERRSTLIALSQTCRTLRRIFFPILWERIEVYDGMKTPGGHLFTHDERTSLFGGAIVGNRKHGEELVRMLGIVTKRNPDLAQYVKILNVQILEYVVAEVKNVLSELARCMALLNHLHTVRLEFCFHSFQKHHSKFLATLLEKPTYTYPQLVNIYASPTASAFVRRCPKAKCLMPLVGYDFEASVAEKNYLPQLEVLGLVHLRNPRDFRVLAKTFPGLRDLTFDSRALETKCQPQAVKVFSQLKHLRTIRLCLDFPGKRLYVDSDNDLPQPPSPKAVNMIKMAQKILADGPWSDPTVWEKQVIVTHADRTVEVLSVSEPQHILVS